MPRRTFNTLLALNLALVALLALVVLASDAGAQNRSRSRGDYAMVGANAIGGSEQALWVVDAANQELIVVRWDRGRKALKSLGFRDLNADAGRAADQTPGNPSR
jgi:hypothetical protein